MSPGQLSLLLGLFGVPALLVWLGHGLRRRTPRQRAAFWGGVIGHSVGVLVTMLLALIPPVAWEGGAGWRATMVHGVLLLGGVVGIAVGYLGSGRRSNR